MGRFGFWTNIPEMLRNWQKILSGGLTFGDNLACTVWTGEIPAGETKAVPHSLKRIPIGYLVLNAKGTNNIIQADTPPPNDKVFYVKNQASSSTFRGKIAILGD